MAFDSYDDAAVYFALEHWTYQGNPPVYPVWSERVGDFALVALSITGIEPYASVLCALSEDGWEGVGWTGIPGSIRVSGNEPLQVTTYYWEVVTPELESVTIRFKGVEQQSQVINKCAVLHALWHFGSDEPKVLLSGEFCVLINERLIWDAALQPSWLFGILASVEDFTQAYYGYYKFGKRAPSPDWWAVEVVFSCKTREDKLDAVRKLIEATADVDKDADYLTYIGAGPLEDMVSDWLLDQIEDEVKEDPKMLIALSGVRLDSEPTELKKRAERLLIPMNFGNVKEKARRKEIGRKKNNQRNPVDKTRKIGEERAK